MKNMQSTKSSAHIVMVAAVPMTLQFFMKPHLAAMVKNYHVTAVCSGDIELLKAALPPGVDCKSVPIERKVALFSDLMTLFRLVLLFRQLRPNLVHSITPKAGLLAMMAAWINRVPVRVHIFTGQVWATKKGVARLLLKSFDRLIALMATHVLADSPSQGNFLVSENIVRDIQVLADGSICGVDSARFKPDGLVRTQVRKAVGIPDDACVVLFLGRLTEDKGVFDLVKAFVQLASQGANTYLLFVGPDEEGLQSTLETKLAAVLHYVRFFGITPSPENYMAAVDIFALPSYREGFGSVILEAAACGVPTVASRIYGITDAVIDGETGILHEPANIESIAAALKTLIEDKNRRAVMGEAARVRALTAFAVQRVVEAQMSFYRTVLDARSS